jgi:branched-chain amino acid transport system substrate-binding protein
VEGNYFSSHYSPQVGTEISKKFVENYAKRWGGKIPDTMAACGYDSALVLADAIKRAGTTDGPKLRNAIAATKDFPAVTGKITINQNRDATKSAVILKIEDGKFKYLETVEP